MAKIEGGLPPWNVEWKTKRRKRKSHEICIPASVPANSALPQRTGGKFSRMGGRLRAVRAWDALRRKFCLPAYVP